MSYLSEDRGTPIHLWEHEQHNRLFAKHGNGGAKDFPPLTAAQYHEALLAWKPRDKPKAKSAEPKPVVAVKTDDDWL